MRCMQLQAHQRSRCHENVSQIGPTERGSRCNLRGQRTSPLLGLGRRNAVRRHRLLLRGRGSSIALALISTRWVSCNPQCLPRYANMPLGFETDWPREHERRMMMVFDGKNLCTQATLFASLRHLHVPQPWSPLHFYSSPCLPSLPAVCCRGRFRPSPGFRDFARMAPQAQAQGDRHGDSNRFRGQDTGANRLRATCAWCFLIKICEPDVGCRAPWLSSEGGLRPAPHAACCFVDALVQDRSRRLGLAAW